MFNFSLLCGQPLQTPSITIENTFIKNKIVCLGTLDGINYMLSIKKKCKNCMDTSFAVRVNDYYNLIYKKDTMQLRLLFDQISTRTFKVEKLFFQKGDLTINLKECAKVLDSNSFPKIIDKLPNDCEAYLKKRL